MFFSNKLVFSILVLLASAGAKAKDVVVSGNLIDSNETCATYRFEDDTLSHPDVSVILINDVDVCFDNRGEIYEFSSPRVLFRGREDELGVWLYFSVGASSKGCVRSISRRYRAGEIVFDAPDEYLDVLATGGGLGYDDRIKYLCIKLNVRYPNKPNADSMK